MTGVHSQAATSPAIEVGAWGGGIHLRQGTVLPTSSASLLLDGAQFVAVYHLLCADVGSAWRVH